MYRDILMVSIIIVILALVCVIVFDAYHGGPPPVQKVATPGIATGGLPTKPPTTNKKRPQDSATNELRKPEVIVFTEKETYSEWFKEIEGESRVGARPPDAIDFDVNQVVAILWGDKPTTGFELSLKSIVIEEQEAIVTVATKLPEPGSGSLVVTYPGVTAVVPRSKRVRLVISGQRMPVVEKFRDFEPLSEPELEVVVRPNELPETPKKVQPKQDKYE
jgi:hypothetical protein